MLLSVKFDKDRHQLSPSSKDPVGSSCLLVKRFYFIEKLNFGILKASFVLYGIRQESFKLN